MSEIKIIDEKYSWRNTTLYEFLQYGGMPHGWLKFFIENSVELGKISDELRDELNESKNKIFYPPIYTVFKCFRLPLHYITVCLIAQDPYSNGTNEYDGSAMGLCFSVARGNEINPSLRNIYRELWDEGYTTTNDGDLSYLASQGVLMLNRSLTVEKGNANSHSHIWNTFTENIVKYIVNECGHVVWILLGNDAQEILPIIGKNKSHTALCASHPSPFSYMKATKTAPAFSGSGIFKKTNECLRAKNMPEIKWTR